MDDGPDARAQKRRRVTRACDRCRSKKDKCDGIRPSCSACLASGQACSYDPIVKKRGLPEGYVRGLEKLWALAICNISGLEDSVLNILDTPPEPAGRTDTLQDLWADERASEILCESWKTSRLFSTLEKLLSESNALPAPGKRLQEGAWDDNDASHADTGTAWGFRVRRELNSRSRATSPVSKPLPANSTKAYHSAPASDTQKVPQGQYSPHLLPLPADTTKLLDQYFAITHSWFPIVAKSDILRASYLYANTSVSTANTRSGDQAALWAVLTYTSAHLEYHSASRTHNNNLKTQEYYSITRSLIPLETEKLELGHVQALLLLSLVNLGFGDWTAAWLQSGQAARMAVSMGLGSLKDAGRSEELRRRKAVFLGCFTLDSILAFRLSRIPCMVREDLASVGMMEEDGLEEWNSWSDVLPRTSAARDGNLQERGPLLALSCFNRMVELASVLNRIAYCCCTDSDTDLFAERLVLELQQWDDCLPVGCRLAIPESAPQEHHLQLLPHQTYLCLTYIATLMWLYGRLSASEKDLHPSQQLVLDRSKKLLSRTLQTLSQHLETFAVCGVPPLFECVLYTIAQQASRLQKVVDLDTVSFSRWSGEFLEKLQELGSWPVFKSLGITIRRLQQSSHPSHTATDNPEPLAGQLESRCSVRQSGSPAATLFSDQRNMMLDMPLSQRRSSARLSDKSELLGRVASVLSNPVPLANSYTTTKGYPTANLNVSLADSSSSQLPFPKNSSLASENLTSPTTATRVPNPPGFRPQPQPPNSPTVPQLPSTPSEPLAQTEYPAEDYPSSQTGYSDRPPDFDNLFNDLAYLDTTEWATSHELGLEDFGFMDDSTFHAFCHDPDRLVGSRPLIRPSTIADIWPPPGFFPETFQDPDQRGETGV